MAGGVMYGIFSNALDRHQAKIRHFFYVTQHVALHSHFQLLFSLHPFCTMQSYTIKALNYRTIFIFVLFFHFYLLYTFLHTQDMKIVKVLYIASSS